MAKLRTNGRSQDEVFGDGKKDCDENAKAKTAQMRNRGIL
jgi:hypothetical protein